jgi:hypothetical protein
VKSVQQTGIVPGEIAFCALLDIIGQRLAIFLVAIDAPKTPTLQ